MTENTITLNIDMTALIGGALGGLIATSWNILPLLAGANLTGAAMQFRPVLIGIGLIIGVGAMLSSARYVDGAFTVSRGSVASVLAVFVLFGSIGYAAAPAALSLSGSSGADQLDNAGLRVATLTVDGMVCQGCRLTVKNYLRSMAGTRKVSIDLSTQQATVIYDPEMTSKEAFVNADVFKGAYSATLVSDRRYDG